MKITNNLLFGLLSLSTALGCNDGDANPQVKLACDWPEGYYSGESFENFNAEVVLSEAALSQKDSIYVIRTSEIVGKLPSGDLNPCNLPDNAMKNGLKVKVSGHIVRFDQFDKSLFPYGYPIEITSIEYLDK